MAQYFFCNGCGEEFFFLRLSMTRNPGEDGEENYCFCCTEDAEAKGEIVAPRFDERSIVLDGVAD
jgi:hypothetical protein